MTMEELEQCNRAQEMTILRLQAQNAYLEKRIAQQQAHIERQARRLALALSRIPSKDEELRKVFG